MMSLSLQSFNTRIGYHECYGTVIFSPSPSWWYMCVSSTCKYSRSSEKNVCVYWRCTDGTCKGTVQTMGDLIVKL